MINIEEIDKNQVDICLNCQLPDCQEKSEGCLLYHPEREDNMGTKEGIIAGSHDRHKNKEKAREYEARKEEIIAVLSENGISIKDASIKLGIPRTTLRGIKARWMPDTQTPELAHQDIDHVENTVPLYIYFEKALEEDSIYEARAFWRGVKAARGIM